MKYKKILISGLGGSLFPYLHNKLKSEGYDLYYVDNNKSLAHIYPDLNFFYAPKVNDPAYSLFIDSLIDKLDIDVYIPLIDEEILLAKEKEYSSDGRKIVVITPAIAFSKLCLHKDLLMSSLASEGISVIETYTGDEFDWQFPAPVFVKPIHGRGSRGVMKINTPAALAAYYILEKYKPNEVIIQPYISGVEYTVGIVVNRDNQLLSISSKKVLQKKGITISAVSENNSAIDNVVEKITKVFNPGGPYNIQLFVTQEGEIKIFEINPRFSTTLVLSYESGIEEITLYLENLTGYTGAVQRPKENVHLYRLWNNIFY